MNTTTAATIKDTTLVAGTFAQTTPQPGPSWHIVKNGQAICRADIRAAEHWTTDQMRTFKVCVACR
jgi:hypothetical protein